MRLVCNGESVCFYLSVFDASGFESRQGLFFEGSILAMRLVTGLLDTLAEVGDSANDS